MLDGRRQLLSHMYSTFSGPSFDFLGQQQAAVTAFGADVTDIFYEPAETLVLP